MIEQLRTSFIDGIEYEGKKVIPRIYITQIEEPEFGCEGRQDNLPVLVKVCFYLNEKEMEEEQMIYIEEQELWESGLDETMYLFSVGKEKIGYSPKFKKKISCSASLWKQFFGKN